MAQLVIAGSTLAALFHAFSVSEFDCEGLLLGEVLEQVEHNKTDGAGEGMDVTTSTAVVQSFRLLQAKGGTHTFYDTKGSLDNTAMDECMGNSSMGCLGWFKFRRNTGVPVRMSLVETAVSQALHRSGKLCSKEFALCAVFTASSNQLGSTHTFDYAWFNVMANSVVAMPLQITNLHHNSDQEYAQFVSLSTDKTTRELLGDTVSTETPTSVVQLETVFEHSMVSLQDRLDQLYQLSVSVSQLEEQIANKTKNHSGGSSSSSGGSRAAVRVETGSSASEDLIELDFDSLTPKAVDGGDVDVDAMFADFLSSRGGK